MKSNILILLLSALIFSLGSYAKKHDGIEVSVKALKQTIGENDDIIVKVTFFNRSGTDQKILKWYLPTDQGFLEESLFVVLSFKKVPFWVFFGF